MSSMDNLHGHVPDIERRNRELGGFLTLFARLPKETQARILQEIARLKQELGNNQEAFLEEVKALAAMYGAIEKGGEGKTKGNLSSALTERLGEIAAAATQLQKSKEGQASKEEFELSK